MKRRPNLKSKAFSVAVLLCVPFIIRCSSDSGGGGTSGAGGEVEPGAGSGGLAYGGLAGSGHAGSAGESASGGADAAGAAGDICAGSAGDISAGTGGVTAGTGGVTAGTGGVSAGTGGVSAGTGGVSAGTGGVAGVAGAGPGILNVSVTSLEVAGNCTAPPQAFTISNTGQSALTWTAALSVPLLVVTPSSSTLLPGTAITVSVSGTTPVQFSPGQFVVLTITSDVPAQPPAAISVFYGVRGTLIGVQPDINFGEVPLGQSKTVSVPAPPHGFVELALGSSNSAFSVANVLLHEANHWTMTFTPSVLGPQSSTLQIIVPFGPGDPVCPSPNLFTARGVGMAP